MTEKKDALDLVAEANKAFEEKLEELSSLVTDALIQRYNAFFDEFPEVDKVVFTAYTPYFNDGDECKYNVNEPEIFVKEGHVLYDLQDNEEYDESAYPLWVNQAIGYLRGRTIQVWDPTEKKYIQTRDRSLFSDPIGKFISAAIVSIDAKGEDATIQELERYIAAKDSEKLPNNSFPNFSKVMERYFKEGKFIVTRDSISVEDYDHE